MVKTLWANNEQSSSPWSSIHDSIERAKLETENVVRVTKELLSQTQLTGIEDRGEVLDEITKRVDELKGLMSAAESALRNLDDVRVKVKKHKIKIKPRAKSTEPITPEKANGNGTKNQSEVTPETNSKEKKRKQRDESDEDNSPAKRPR